MSEKVFKAGIKKDKAFLYYLDKGGNVARAPLVRKGSKTKGKPEKIVDCKVKREQGWLYFIDKDGDVSRAKMARRGKKK